MTIAAPGERRTSADIVFERLYEEIVSLGLLPGERISEADVAERFGVSRQPVREAFNRLGNLDLLLIQPQRATLVQKFSQDAIDNARFVRLAIELEVAREAARHWSDAFRSRFERNLSDQDKAAMAADRRRFHALDEAFHRLIADVAGKPRACDLVMQKKAMVDRLCVLSLKDGREMQEIVGDHRAVYAALAAGDRREIDRLMRNHLSRIEKTIEAVRESHPEYFDT